MYIAAQLLLVFLCLYSSFLIKSGLSDGPFSIGGKCVESSIMNDFKMNKFQGIWYEQMRFPNVYEGDADDTTCIRYNFTQINNTAMIFNATAYKTIVGQDVKFNGELSNPKLAEPNKFNVKYDVDFFTLSSVQVTGRYDIWDTDYQTYALIYSCSPYKVMVLNFKTEAVWLLTRSKQPLSDDILSRVKARLDAKKLNSTQLQTIEQEC